MVATYCNTVLKKPLQLPLSSFQVANFIAYLHNLEFASATICTYVSAISYVHKLSQGSDPTNNFIVQKALAGVQRLSPKGDKRLPITTTLLLQLLNAVDNISKSGYEQYLLKAMFLTSFFGFFRVGEITSDFASNSLILFNQLHLSKNRAMILLTRFKHNATSRQFEVVMDKKDNKLLCPVRGLSNYILVRGQSDGPLFRFVHGKPIARSYYCKQLQLCLKFAGLNPAFYKTHSFRIGAASYAASLGLSDSEIRLLGRWSSDAFKTYIRQHPSLPDTKI